jgi:Repeat of unknown function (DUF346)
MTMRSVAGGAVVALALSVGMAGGASAETHAPEVEAYQEAFGVSTAAAEQGLAVQHRGTDIVEQLEGILGPEYAGVWFDADSAEFVVPLPPGADRGAAIAALSKTKVKDDFRIHFVRHEWGELEAAQGQLDEEIKKLTERGAVDADTVRTSLDPQTNEIVIAVAANAGDEEIADISRVADGSDVTTEVRQSNAERFQSQLTACSTQFRNCGLPFRGGVEIGYHRDTGNCTAAFRAKGLDGRRYVLTAGHCVALPNPGNPVLYWDAWDELEKPYLGDAHLLGKLTQFAFPSHDWAKIDATGTDWDKPSWPAMVAYWGVNQEYPIYGEAASYLNQVACHAGMESGSSCGVVKDLHVTEDFEENGTIWTITNLTEARGEQLCTIGGDSGGPWFAAHTALGIHTGWRENRCAPGNLLYGEITEATKDLGVRITASIEEPAQGTSWHSGDNLGGDIRSDPDITSWGSGRLDAFARGADNQLWHKYFNGYGWTNWEPLGGALASGVGAVSWGPGRIDVVGRNANNNLLHWWFNGTHWQFENMGGYIEMDPDISSWGVGRLDVFAKSKNNTLLHRYYDNGIWRPWADLGGAMTSGPGAVSWGPGRIDVVARTPTNSVNHWWFDGYTWTGNDNLGGTISSAPDLSSWGVGRLDLFARGAGPYENHLWHRYFTGYGWAPWENLGGSFVSGPGSVSWGPGRIDILGRNANNQVAHWWWG